MSLIKTLCLAILSFIGRLENKLNLLPLLFSHLLQKCLNHYSKLIFNHFSSTSCTINIDFFGDHLDILPTTKIQI